MNTEKLNQELNQITLRICLSDPINPLPFTFDNYLDAQELCLESESFHLFPSASRAFRWESKLKPRLLNSNDYYLVVEGNAKNEDESCTWLDSEYGSAATAYQIGTHQEWINDTMRYGVYSTRIVGHTRDIRMSLPIK